MSTFHALNIMIIVNTGILQHPYLCFNHRFESDLVVVVTGDPLEASCRTQVQFINKQDQT